MLNFTDYSRLTSNNKIIETKPQNLVQNNIKKDEKTINSTVLINNPANVISINKGKLALTLAITGTICAAVAVALCNKKISSLSSECSKLKNALNDAPKHATSDAVNNSELAKAQKIIKELEEKIKKLSNRTNSATPLSDEAQEAIGTKTARYREIISNIETIYEDVEAPKGKTFYIPPYKKLFTFQESKLPHGTKAKNNFIENLIEEFRNKKRIEIPQIHQKTAQETIENAKIKPQDLGELAKPQKTSLKVAYGQKVQWSDEKVARDILQNFYDANDHTLDGVGFLAEELPNGHYKVKISGNGVFNYDKLRLMGDTTKTSDLYDAGGFGEGSKIVIANMLANNNADEIKFRSADWELVFDGKGAGEVIRTTLNKSSEIMDGNCIEFETKNKTFVEKIISAINYFKHKNNPDFQDFTFENDKFGFRILNPEEKGNFYLTQRFEFENKDAWEDSVEGLNIIFKKRPDPDKYKEITGRNFDTGRDRSKMTCDDIFDLTCCFNDEMSNDELIDSILATNKYWQAFKENKKTPIKSLLIGLLKEANKRNIVIDFNSEKICQDNGLVSPTIIKYLENEGYTVIMDKEVPFININMPTTYDVYNLMSSHKALKPTKKEAQKLKILEMATDVLQKHFGTTYIKQLNEIFESLNPEDLKLTELGYFTKFYLKNLDDLTFDKNVVNFSNKLFLNSYQDEILDVDKFNEQLFEYIQKKINTITPQNINDDKTVCFLNLLTSILKENSKNNGILQEYATRLANIDIVSEADIKKPRFIFDRKNELSTSTLGEAIINGDYQGHWIDRTYLNKGSFQNLLATWLHEICHKSGGDGTSEFTYKLTDMIESLLTVSTQYPELQTELISLQKVFDEIK